jgi:hypothetical protein
MTTLEPLSIASLWARAKAMDDDEPKWDLRDCVLGLKPITVSDVVAQLEAFADYAGDDLEHERMFEGILAVLRKHAAE